MANIKQFNKSRTMIQKKRATPITIAGLKRVEVSKPRVVKATGRRGSMKIR